MLEVRSVRKRFGSVTAVDGVSFAAPDGQITGLLGENGAGKTTTLAMIGGVLTPDVGLDRESMAPTPQVNILRCLAAQALHLRYRCLSMPSFRILNSSVDAGSPSLRAAPRGPEMRPREPVSALSMAVRSLDWT